MLCLVCLITLLILFGFRACSMRFDADESVRPVTAPLGVLVYSAFWLVFMLSCCFFPEAFEIAKTVEDPQYGIVFFFLALLSLGLLIQARHFCSDAGWVLFGLSVAASIIALFFAMGASSLDSMLSIMIFYPLSLWISARLCNGMSIEDVVSLRGYRLAPLGNAAADVMKSLCESAKETALSLPAKVRGLVSGLQAKAHHANDASEPDASSGLKPLTNMHHLDRFADAIYGVAIGDALGVPFEFRDRGPFVCNRMAGHGTHDQAAGTWSDDTAMTLALAKSLLDNGGEVNTEDIRSNFNDWLDHGQFTANGTVFDAGGTVIQALQSGEPGLGKDDNGNGSLMRTLPLAFTDCSDDEIRAVSAITHGHEIAMDGCVIYVNAARRLLEGESLEDILGSMEFPQAYRRLGHIKTVKRKRVHNTGYVVHTLEAAMWCLLRNDSYEDSVLAAVNLGGDTDTIAAVTGGIAGIMYGLESDACREWLDILKGKSEIERCIFRVRVETEGGREEANEDEEA